MANFSWRLGRVLGRRVRRRLVVNGPFLSRVTCEGTVSRKSTPSVTRGRTIVSISFGRRLDCLSGQVRSGLALAVTASGAFKASAGATIATEQGRSRRTRQAGQGRPLSTCEGD